MIFIQTTNHVTMRLLQRKHSEFIINDATFKAWRRTHEDKVLEAEREVVEIYNKCTEELYLDQKYSINLDDMWVFVADDDKLISMWDLKYSDDIPDESTRIIVNTLLENYKKINTEYVDIKETYEIEKINNGDIVKFYDLEIQSLKAKINEIEAKKAEVSAHEKSIKAELDQKKNAMLALGKRIVKPITTFK